jgi:hypothetical protein
MKKQKTDFKKTNLLSSALLMSGGRDVNHLLPEDESCFHHFPISASWVQVSPYSEVRCDDPEGRKKTLRVAR